MNNDVVMWAPGMSLETVEKDIILKAFRFYRGNKTATSASLGISIRTLENKLGKYEADLNAEKEREENGKQRSNEYLNRARGNPTQNADGYSVLSSKSGHSQGGPDNSTRPAVTTNAAQASQASQVAQGGSVHSANEGLRMEPASKTSTQQAVSLPKQSQVQTVLPKQTSEGHSRKSR